MATSKKVPTEKGVLEQVKRIEKIKKAQLLAEVLSEIKDKAREVLVLKEETKLLLEEIGLCATDVKKVIDYINSIVKLTPSDKKEIKEGVKETKEEKEEKVEKKMDKQPYPDFTSYANYYSSVSTTDNLDNCVYSITGTEDLSVMLGDSKLKM